MKKLLILLLFAATGSGAQAVLTTRGATAKPFYGQMVESVSLGALPNALVSHGDCEHYETLTPWAAKSEGNATRTVHAHEWVYAEREDVNHKYIITTAGWDCSCGCPTTENQARICKACFRHEWRTREYCMKPKDKARSKYLQIVEAIKE